MEQKLNNLDIIRKIDGLKAEIDVLRPLPSQVHDKVMQKLEIDWNWHSNVIEGNKLTRGETIIFLKQELMAGNKSKRDHIDIEGHKKAIDFLFDLIKDDRSLSESDIRDLHKILLQESHFVQAITNDGHQTRKEVTPGKYKTTPNHPLTPSGDIHYYASPEETPAKMQELNNWYRNISSATHPLVKAALFHYKFVAIHPFDDGNGRLSRLLMNLVLIKAGFPPAVIRKDDKDKYFGFLEVADLGEIAPFVNFIGESLVHSMEIYLKAARGEDYSEHDDIDKDIDLFIKSIKKSDKKENNKSRSVFVEDEIIPLLNFIEQKVSKFNDLFKDHSYRIYFRDEKTFEDEETNRSSIDNLLKIIDLDPNLNLGIALVFDFNFWDFKSHNNQFDLGFSIYIDLLKTHCLIEIAEPSYTRELKYNEEIRKHDKQEITKSIIDYIKKQIEEKTQNKEGQ